MATVDDLSFLRMLQGQARMNNTEQHWQLFEMKLSGPGMVV
jgi:hypothetical protein